LVNPGMWSFSSAWGPALPGAPLFTGICDNNSRRKTDAKPSGIEQVFINGQQVLKEGKVAGEILAGKVL